VLCCPAPDCKNRLFPTDVTKLLTLNGDEADEEGLHVRALAKYDDLLTADYDARLRDVFDSTDAETQLCIYLNSRVCPGCKVILTRNGGCPDFHCSCGENFHYWSASQVIHYQWVGGTHSYTQVLRSAIANDISVVDTIAQFLPSRKRAVGKIRTLLQQQSPELGWEAIEELARGAVMGDDDAVDAVRQARDQKRRALAEKKECLVEKSAKRKAAKEKWKAAKEKWEAAQEEAAKKQASSAMSCLLTQTYP
jgi:hypothetical protein